MQDTFSSGYTSCLLNLQEEIKHAKKMLFPRSSVKQLKYISSLVDYLLKNQEARELYRMYGGVVWRKVGPKGEVLKIAERKDDLKIDGNDRKAGSD